MPFRSPYVESIKVAFVDRNKQVIESRMVTVGLLDVSLIHPREMFRNMPEGTAGVLVAHNHPSGDPTPSREDIAITKQLVESAKALDVPLMDHLITNGGKFVSMRSRELIRFEKMKPRRGRPPKLREPVRPIPEMEKVAAWEVVPRAELTAVRTPEDLSRLAAPLRQVNPNAGHIVYLTAKNGALAIERVPMDIERSALHKRIASGVGRHGAAAFVVDWPSEQEMHAVEIAEDLIRLGGILDVKVLDVTTLDKSSLRETGALTFEERARYPERPEPGEPVPFEGVPDKEVALEYGEVFRRKPEGLTRQQMIDELIKAEASIPGVHDEAEAQDIVSQRLETAKLVRGRPVTAVREGEEPFEGESPAVTASGLTLEQFRPMVIENLPHIENFSKGLSALAAQEQATGRTPIRNERDEIIGWQSTVKYTDEYAGWDATLAERLEGAIRNFKRGKKMTALQYNVLDRAMELSRGAAPESFEEQVDRASAGQFAPFVMAKDELEPGDLVLKDGRWLQVQTDPRGDLRLVGEDVMPLPEGLEVELFVKAGTEDYDTAMRQFRTQPKPGTYAAFSAEPGEVEQPWQLTRQELRDNYEKPPAAKELARWEGDIPPVGTWRLNPDGNLEQLQWFRPDEIVAREPVDVVKAQPQYQAYVKWAQEGHIPPPISVATDPSGQLRSDDSRRVAAAQEAESEWILGWLSETDAAGRSVPNMRDLVKKAIAEEKAVPPEVLAEYPGLPREVTAESTLEAAEMEREALRLGKIQSPEERARGAALEKERLAGEREKMQQRLKLTREQRDLKIAETQAKKRQALLNMRSKMASTEERRKQIRAYAQEHLEAKDRQGVLAMVSKKYLSENDLEKALERIDGIEAMAKHRKATKRLQKVVRITEKRLKLRTGKRTVKPPFREALQSLVDSMDPTRPSVSTLEAAEASRDFFAENPQLEEEMPPRIRRRIERLGKQPIPEMRIEDIQETEAAIQILLRQNDLEGRLIAVQKWRDLDTLAQEALKTLPTHAKSKALTIGGKELRTTPLGSIPKTPGAPPTRTWLGRLLVDMYNDIDLMTRTMDAKEDGPWAEAIARPLDRAEAKRLETLEDVKVWLRAELARQGADIKEDLFMLSDVLPGLHHTSEHKFPAVRDDRGRLVSPEKTIHLTPMQKIDLLLTARDEDGMRSLNASEENRIVRTRQAGVLRRERKASLPLGRITPEMVAQLEKTLTKTERGIMETIYNFNNILSKRLINETSMDIEGVPYATEEHYYGKETVEDFIRKSRTAGILPGRSFTQQTLEDRGWLKERLPGAAAPIVIRDAFEKLQTQIAQVIAYNAYARPLREIKTVMGWQGQEPEEGRRVSLTSEMRKHYGSDWVRDLQTMIARVEGTSYQMDPFEHVVEWLRGRVVGAILTGRPTVWLKQASSMPLFALELGYDNMLEGLKIRNTHDEKHGPIIDAIIEKSPEIKNRLIHGRVSRDIGDYIGRQFMLDMLADKRTVGETLSAGVRGGDAVAIRRGVWMAYRRARQDVGEAASMDEATDRAAYWLERGVRRTQPSWHLKDLSLIGGSPNLGTRWVHVFRSFLDRVIKMQRLNYMRYREGDRTIKDKTKLVRDQAFIQMVVALLGGLINQTWRAIGRRKRDPKSMGEHAQDLGWRALDNAFGEWWLVGDAASIYLRKVRGKDWRGDDMLRAPVVETLGQIVEVAAETTKAIKYKGIEPDDKKFDQAMKNLLRVAPELAGRMAGVSVEGIVDIGQTVAGAKGRERKRRLMRFKGERGEKAEMREMSF
jgi:hypothetical protein